MFSIYKKKNPKNGFVKEFDNLKKLRTQLNSDISIRYNAETDYVQLLQGGAWQNWMRALLNKFYIIREGKCLVPFDGAVTEKNGYVEFLRPNDSGSPNGGSTIDQIDAVGYKKLSIVGAVSSGNASMRIDFGGKMWRTSDGVGSINITDFPKTSSPLTIQIYGTAGHIKVYDVWFE